MKKIMIFEFNRTLFDTGRRALFDDARQLLQAARDAGFELILVARRLGFSQSLFDNADVKKFFREVHVVESKSLELFEELASGCDDRERSFVVGDRMREEIRYGNLQGFSTVLVRRGWFTKETPAGIVEVPDYAIESLDELVPLLA